MPEFDEDFYDAMTDEELSEYLAHDAELPLSFVRNADAVLYAATLLAIRQNEELPEAAAALETFAKDYQLVPFDGCTLWDDPPRFSPVQAKETPQAQSDLSAVSPPAPPKQSEKSAGESAEKSPPIQNRETLSDENPPKFPPSPPPIQDKTPQAPPDDSTDTAVPEQPPKRAFLRSRAGLLVAALLLLLLGAGFLYIRSAVQASISSEASPSPSPAAAADVSSGLALTWVPDGYTSTSFSGWDVSGYLYDWQNDNGDKISFSRHPGSSNVAVDQHSSDTTIVPVCGVNGEYTVNSGERSLVFSDKSGTNVYYLDAKNVSGKDMQKMIASIK